MFGFCGICVLVLDECAVWVSCIWIGVFCNLNTERCNQGLFEIGAKRIKWTSKNLSKKKLPYVINLSKHKTPTAGKFQKKSTNHIFQTTQNLMTSNTCSWSSAHKQQRDAICSILKKTSVRRHSVPYYFTCLKFGLI